MFGHTVIGRCPERPGVQTTSATGPVSGLGFPLGLPTGTGPRYRIGITMPATPREIPPDEPRMFTARYHGICGCGDEFYEGDMIGYNLSGTLFAQQCCGHSPEPTPNQERQPNIRVMPTGKTKRDVCSRCFIIHTAAQGDECE